MPRNPTAGPWRTASPARSRPHARASSPQATSAAIRQSVSHLPSATGHWQSPVLTEYSRSSDRHYPGRLAHEDSDSSGWRVAGPDLAALANAPGGRGRFAADRDADARSKLGPAGAAALEGKCGGVRTLLRALF